MSEPKEMSTETRSLLAAVLCLVVIAGWALIYKPAPPPAPAKTIQPPAAPATPVSGAPSTKVGAAASAPPIAMHAAGAEHSLVVESDLYHVEISNRGAVVRSWQLKKFTDDNKPPRTLDLVHSDAAQQAGAWPFSLALDDAQQQSSVNNALYEVTAPGNPAAGTILRAPAEITMTWSDGHLEVTKDFKFNESYIVEVQSSVKLDGSPLRTSIAWTGGFGDATAYRAALQTQVFTNQAGKLNTLAAKNLGKSGQANVPAPVAGTYDFAGIEDLYFAAAFMPPFTAHGDLAQVPIAVTGWNFQHTVQTSDNKTETELVPEVAAGLPAPGPVDFRVYVGPKSIDGLKAVRPPLNSIVQFGWWGPIAEPLFYSLRWLYHYIPNYGWAIVALTIGINMVMFPLKVKSMRAMQKMQTVAPEIKSIQDRYKKYSMRDPRKAEMNKEVMAVYSREGINPLGSCWPTLIQMPIWFGLYRMLANTIELRHAPWLLWIHDLSSRDPYFILPITMSVSMYLMQKMTPTPGMDPAQAKLMGLTPLLFGAMFALYPSGLALYILTSNIVGIGQQWYLYRTAPPPPKLPRGPSKKK